MNFYRYVGQSGRYFQKLTNDHGGSFINGKLHSKSAEYLFEQSLNFDDNLKMQHNDN